MENKATILIKYILTDVCPNLDISNNLTIRDGFYNGVKVKNCNYHLYSSKFNGGVPVEDGDIDKTISRCTDPENFDILISHLHTQGEDYVTVQRFTRVPIFPTKLIDDINKKFQWQD